MRVLVPAIKNYQKLGSKGNATTGNYFCILMLASLLVTSLERNHLSLTAHASFERCERDAITNELSRIFVAKDLERARLLLSNLTDERLG